MQVIVGKVQDWQFSYQYVIWATNYKTGFRRAQLFEAEVNQDIYEQVWNTITIQLEFRLQLNNWPAT